MRENDLKDATDLSLFDLWQIVSAGWRWVAGGALLGAIGAGLAFAILPLQFEAVAIVQVGQVGHVGQGGLAENPIEPPLQAIERMRTGSFQIEAATSAGYRPWLDAVARSPKTGERYFSAQLLKNTQLIEIKAKAGSPGDAGRIVTAIVNLLNKRHDDLAAPSVKRLRDELEVARERLRLAGREGSLVFAARDSERSNVQSSLLHLDDSIRRFRQPELFAQYQLISAALTPPATRPTGTVEPLFLGESPTGPNKMFIAVLGILGGLMFGVLTAFLVNSWQSRNGVPS